MRPREKKPPATSRCIGFVYHYDPDLSEREALRLIDEALAVGTLTQGVCRRGVLWFNGPPGLGMRKVRAALVAALPGCVQVPDPV